VVGVPTVNIGPRQDGRLRAPSVIDCAEDADAIATAIEKALSPSFRADLVGMSLPYGEGDTSRKIVDVLRDTPLGDELVMKHFFDLPWTGEGMHPGREQRGGDTA
jgi:hypothetical protein